MRMLKSCHTVQEVFAKKKSIYPGLTYQRIPLTDCCAPNEEVIQPIPLADYKL